MSTSIRALSVSESAVRPTQTSVLIVDDSAFMRKLIAEMVQSEPGFTVTGFARNGVDALQQIELLRPDIVTLDLEMPQLDGMQVLRTVMTSMPRPVVVLSAGGPRFGDATMRALALGAFDFVQKPSGPISLDLERIRDRLLEALRAAAVVDIATLRPPLHTPDAPAVPVSPVRAPSIAERVVVITASTGGPRALTKILPALPSDLPAAVLIAQHMPREFTPSFAAHLDRVATMRVAEGQEGEPVYAGRVYLAPGGTHMRVCGTRLAPVIAIEPVSPETRVCPSADLLFTSASALFGRDVISVVLTGMGRDGAEGTRAIRAAGGRTFVQDRESSAIYGMPHAALDLAAPHSEVSLSSVPASITNAVTLLATPTTVHHS